MALISPVAFYKTSSCVKPSNESSRNAELEFYRKLREVENRAKLYNDRPLVPKEKKSSFDSYSVWETFGTQNQAFEFCLHCREKINRDARLFSQEKSDDGKRNFLVSSSEEFWRRYKLLSDDKKNFYEVIESGRPCRLYFDLEFHKEPNPNLNGIEVLNIFIKTVCFYLQEMFSIPCYRGNIVDLDSTTETKFSRHLIFHLPNTVFVNNIACGYFVRYIYEMTRRKAMKSDKEIFGFLKSMTIEEREILPPQDLEVEKLFVQKKDGNISYFCDLGVYTKNRNFRLYGSRKFGKSSNLKIANENGFHGLSKRPAKSSELTLDSEYTFFLNTMVCPPETFNATSQILTFGETEAIPEHTHIWNKAGMNVGTEEGYKESPFPKLDAFVLNHLRKQGTQGVIRRWMHFVHSNLVIYDIGKNRWCYNIQRAHKSNHIYYVVDLKLGVFYQKCHDPECQDFKSAEMALPADVNPVFNDSEYYIDDFEDSSQLLYDAVEAVECQQSISEIDFDDKISEIDFDDKISEIDFDDEMGFFCDDFQPPLQESEPEMSNNNKNLSSDEFNKREISFERGSEILQSSECCKGLCGVEESSELLNKQNSTFVNEGGTSFQRKHLQIFEENDMNIDEKTVSRSAFQRQEKDKSNCSKQSSDSGCNLESTPLTSKRKCLDDSFIRREFSNFYLDDELDEELINWT